MVHSTFRTPGRCNLYTSPLSDYERIGLSNQQRQPLDRLHDSPSIRHQRKRRFKPLIENRCSEIHDASTPEQWRHVPTSLNPADEGLRGTDKHTLKWKCRWLFGPKFVLQPEDQWPVKEIGKTCDNDKEVEVEKHVKFITRGSELDLPLRRYASWPKLQTLVEWFRGLHHQQEWSS